MSTTSDLSNSIRAQYVEEYILGAQRRRVYDYYTYPISTDRTTLQRQSSIVVPFLSRMTPQANLISESVDITPQSLFDATASMSITSRGDAIQDSEKLLLTTYTDYAAQRARVVGENMMETIEAALIDVALAGSVVQRYTARASLDAGTAAHRLSYLAFQKMENRLEALRCPMFEDTSPGWMATVPSDVYYDLRTDSTSFLPVAQYQNANILFGIDEIGSIGKIRIVKSPWAKVFGGAGAANASAGSTTLAADVNPLSKTIVVASASNLSSGAWLTIGTTETANTFYPNNERVMYLGEASTTITVAGAADNGGLQYAHASGTAVKNADSVYPVLVGGPFSVAKAYATENENGEYGTMVGPLKQGVLEQWASLGWKWYGGFGLISENWLGRIEVSSSLDA